MHSDSQYKPRSYAVALAIALLQGLTLSLLQIDAEDYRWLEGHPGLHLALQLTAIFAPPAVYVLSEWMSTARMWICVSILLAVLVAIGAHYGLRVHETGPGVFDFFPLLLVTFCLLFHALPFVQAYLESGSVVPTYARLFHFAWRNAVLLALGVLFTGVTWLLLWVWAALFRMIGIDVFEVLFFHTPRFALLLLALIFGIAYHLAGSTDKLTLALRQQLLVLLKWLAPLAVFILVAFSIALAVKTPEILASKKHVISATWLLWLTAITIYLFNAAYQDGTIREPYSKRLGQALRIAPALLVFVTALAGYALLVRVEAYGLTVWRVWGLFVLAVTLSYALGYTWAARRADPWLGGAGAVNTAIAAGIVGLLALMSLPPLSPYRLAAMGMAHYIRVNPGKADRGSYSALRFDDGAYGRDELHRLAIDDGAGIPEEVRTVARNAEAATNPWAFATERVRSPIRLDAFPAGHAIEVALQRAIETDANVRSDPCNEMAPCLVLFVDLTGSGEPHAVLFAVGSTIAYRRDGMTWRRAAGAVATSGDCRPCQLSVIRERLLQGDFRTKRPSWQQLEIGSHTYTFLPAN